MNTWANATYNMSVNFQREIPAIDRLISDVCRQWDNKTIFSHYVYVKLLVIAAFLQLIAFFWNPRFLWKIGDTVIWDTMRTGVMIDLRNFVIICMICLIVDAFYISYFIVERHTIGQFLTMLWTQPIIVR